MTPLFPFSPFLRRGVEGNSKFKIENSKFLPFDHPALGTQNLAQGISVVSLDLDVGFARLATASAGALELSGEFFQEGTVAWQVLDHGDGLALAARLLDPEARSDSVGHRLIDM